MAPEIAYIIGSGRSGSTILDMMLGANSRAISVGSVEVLEEYMETGNYCTCRQPLTECELWGPVLYGDGGLPVPASLNVDGQMRKALAILPAIATGRPRSMPRADVERTWRMFDRVGEVSGADVVIDSTKSLLRFARLAAEPQGHDMRLIHLVRDPRGFILSRSRSRPVPTARGEPGTTRQQPATLAYVDWVIQNILVSLYGKLHWRDRYTVVTYEEMVSSPAETLERLAAFLGLEFEPDRQLPPVEGDFHLLGGNASRLVFSGLRLDERWRTELSGAQRLAIQVGAGWLYGLLRRSAERQRRTLSVAQA
jgi:hypothetical protein